MSEVESQLTEKAAFPLMSEAQRFQIQLDESGSLKEKYVDTQINWYSEHTSGPRLWFRLTGMMLILFSALLPAFASSSPFKYRDAIIAALGIGVALLAGAASFFRWERTWKGNSNAQVAIEQFVAKWALELSRARNSMAPEVRILHVQKATDDLLANVRAVMAAEAGTFFEGLKIPCGQRHGVKSLIYGALWQTEIPWRSLRQAKGDFYCFHSHR